MLFVHVLSWPQGDAPEVGPSKRPRRETKPTPEVASSPPPQIPMSVAQATVGSASSADVTVTASDNPLATVRKGKRKRAAPIYLGDEEAESSTGKAAPRRKTPAARKKKTVTKGKGKGKVVSQAKGRGEGKDKGKDKAKARKKIETPVADESYPEDIFIAASALLDFGTLETAPADATEQAAQAMIDLESFTASTQPPTGEGGQLGAAQSIIDLMATTVSMTRQAPDGFGAILRACDDERTDPGTRWVVEETAAAGPGGGAGGVGGAGGIAGAGG